MTIDIFAQAKEKEIPQWFKFTNPGDAIQGTYVGKIIGAIDGYGNKQIIYQLLDNSGKLFNIGFGLNKKVINQEMSTVRFGQIVGFKYKGTIKVKDKFGKMVSVKDYAIFHDPKLVNEAWLKENASNMPNVIQMNEGGDVSVDGVPTSPHKISNMTEDQKYDEDFEKFMGKENAIPSVTPSDKLGVIEKLAKDKLGVVEPFLMKEKVMEVTQVAFIPTNYDKIIQALNTIGA